jgi:hypothetical protein
MDSTKQVLQTFLRVTKDIKATNPLLLLALGLVPLCLLIWRLENKNTELQIWTKKIEALEEKARSLENSKAAQDRLWQNVKQCNPSYLSQSVETLSLLTPELHRVQALVRQYPSNTALQERLSFLQGDNNRIRFEQLAHHEGSFFQETEHKMQNSVQMNDDDLKKFLSAIEDHEESGRPLLVIKAFELKKTKEKADEFVYNIQAEIIQRTP